MTATRLQLTGLPDWPRWLSRDEAAAYVGVAVNTFDSEVAAGAWPAGVIRPLLAGPRARPRLSWDRTALDKCSDQISGVR